MAAFQNHSRIIRIYPDLAKIIRIHIFSNASSKEAPLVFITDALNMTAITDYYTADEAAVKAIQSGADMLIV